MQTQKNAKKPATRPDINGALMLGPFVSLLTTGIIDGKAVGVAIFPEYTATIRGNTVS
jgi:hypothetical protein